jgi:hypothetical protein
VTRSRLAELVACLAILAGACWIPRVRLPRESKDARATLAITYPLGLAKYRLRLVSS